MPREPSYGEIAYTTFHRLNETNILWDTLDESTKGRWENSAANVIAQFRKRQVALSKQTEPQAHDRDRTPES